MCLRLPLGFPAPAWLLRCLAGISGRREYGPRLLGLPARMRSPRPVGRVWRERERQPARAQSAQRRRGYTLFAAVFVCLLAGFAGFVFVEVRLKPTLLQLAEARARAVATTAVNSALSETSALDIKYEDLMDWKTDSQGKIVAVQPNTGEINRIAASTTTRVQAALRDIKNVRISVPIGQVFGSALLANLGPWLTISVVPIGVVSTAVTDQFETAGINQLRHRVYLEIEAYVRILVPLVSSSLTVRTSMPIAESIILGDVPQFYVHMEESGQFVRGLLSSGELQK